MEFMIYDKPCLILETAELVYAFVNHIPAKSLTREGPYCIPADQVTEIQKEVTKDLNPEDEELLFYFKGVPVEGREERLSCLACTLLYFKNPATCHEVDEALEYIHGMWANVPKPFSVSSFHAFTLCFAGTSQYTNLSREICRLPLPQQYQIHLIEVFSGFDWHLDRVGNILRPLAEKLKPLLEPWVENAAALREQWRKHLQTPEGNDILPTRANIKNEDIQEVRFSMRYFSPQGSPGQFITDLGIVEFHMGVFVLPSGEHPVTDTPLATNDYTTFRLLSSPDCMAVLRAVTKTEKSIQELSQEMDMNPGSVFRHVNNLYNAGLLNLKVIHNRNYYTANLPRLKKLTDHLLAHLGWSE